MSFRVGQNRRNVEPIMVPMTVSYVESIRSIEESFADRQAIFDEIDEMKMKLKEVRSRGWPHGLLRTDG
ncbi:hypothetical protein [Celeribacter sp. HF31]|uniref:hypothetical protein n=1 Tax=Celeribacter sp. HF31 TaxID=2721558 RepID=UPI00143081FD|nr:hypothetical protein [Celeribacter sp. HF31]